MIQDIETVSIRPGVSLLSVLPHLNYKPWYALAEFVDNAIQSYQASRTALRKVEGKAFTLAIDIDIDVEQGEIVVRDNAAGIAAAAYARAFRPAEAPLDATGLSEFGMGMKSAAAWLSPRWSVRTSALGEPVERTVSFDIEAIVASTAEELEVTSSPAPRDAHYTEIVLRDLRRAPRSRTLGKIKEHLASLYRSFLARGDVVITLDGEPLAFDQPEVLVAPYWRAPNEAPREWRVPIRLELDRGRRVEGWAALRAKGSTTRAGFALLRRDRVIEGSGDEPYRPRELFGASNSFTYQRLFGELSLIGFTVSHTKDGVRWDEGEEELISKLKAHLARASMPLLDQAQNWRAGDQERRAPPESASAPEPSLATASPVEAPRPRTIRKPARVAPAAVAVEHGSGCRRTQIELGGERWDVDLTLDYDGGDEDWLAVSTAPRRDGARQLQVRLSMRHPFSEAFVEDSGTINEGVARLATGLAIAEVIAQEDGVRYSGRIRSSLNELLLTELAER